MNIPILEYIYVYIYIERERVRERERKREREIIFNVNSFEFSIISWSTNILSFVTSPVPL